MTLFRCAAVAAAIAAAACGGNKSTTPTVATPRYNGSWIGNYTVTSCSQDGQYAALSNDCGDVFTIGRALPYGLVATQTNSNVSGTFVLGMVNFAFASTPIASDGSLTITGTGTAPGAGVTYTYTPIWSLRLNGIVLSGSLTMSLTATGVTGGAAVAGTISTSTKQTVVASQTAPLGVAPRSIDDVWSALTASQKP